jgi:ATP-dependent Clp protease protease subunit
MSQLKPFTNHENNEDEESSFLTNFFTGNKTTNDNKIYFYEEINPITALMLNKQINEKGNELMALSIKYSLEKPIPLYIHVNSPGGDMFSALSIMDNVVASKIPIISRIEGVCASAATFFHLFASRRQIRRHSHILIHELSSGHHGKYSDSKTHLENLDNFMKMMKSLYKEKTKMPEKVLEEVLKKDLYLDSKLALKYGFVDEII